jgi:hypothetical protein
MSSFLWYVTDNFRVYIKSVHGPLDIEMYSLFHRPFSGNFGILGVFFVVCIIALSFLDISVN